jgi:hypothetical protein
MTHRRRRPKPILKAVVKEKGGFSTAEKLSVVVSLVLVVVLLVAFSPRPPPDYVQCTSSGAAQHLHFNLFIQVGERHGELNLSFISLPQNLGLGLQENSPQTCQWPIHTLTRYDVNEFGRYYARVHVQAPWAEHEYTLADMFEVWGMWQGYKNPLYFQSDGVSYYRTANLELLIHTGAVIDPHNNTYSQTTKSHAFGSYVPRDGDYVEIIVHEPYTTRDVPY